MSSNTSRLQLKRPDGSDPFKRQDYVDLLNTLDSYPGVRPCLSTSRPSYGPSQAGMLIQETDTGRLLRWTGTAWTVIENYGKVFGGSIQPGDTVPNNTNRRYTVYSDLTVTRACKLAIVLTARFTLNANLRQIGTLDLHVDDTSAGFGSPVSFNFPDTGDGSGTSAQHVTVMGTRTVSPGAHDIQAYVSVGNSYTNDITVSSFRAMIWLAE